ncbi:MAG: NAD-binding protein [Chloroflexi bacterium]|nr:NAD-binding protein [Chloroflexota bacterium]
MRVVILGCGRTGSAIASSLAAEGDRVSVIDLEQSNFSRLTPSHLDSGAVSVIEGDGTLFSILARAEVEDADLFVALTGQDTINALAAQKVRAIFDTKQIIIRVKDPSLGEMYSALGYEIYCPTENAVSEIVESLNREM